MIERLTIENFKSLKRVDLTLGPLNIFIGPNASGKSNLFDALRVLQGLSYGFTVNEVFDGKPKSATNVMWDGIRGGSSFAVSAASSIEQDFRLTARFRADANIYDYHVVLNPHLGKIVSERLYLSDDKISATPEEVTDQTKSLYWIAAYERFGNLQQLNFTPSHLREYAQHQTVNRIGEQGEDFAALVNTLIANPQTRTDYVSWLRELVPAEVEDVVILKGALGEPLFALKEGDTVFPAPVLSDGTLRFAALTAALFQPDAPRITLIEEIENGINPARLRLLVELLRNRASAGQTQLFVTTHSPALLDWLTPEDYTTTFLCQRDEDGLSHIHPLSEIPDFATVIQITPPSELFAEGWLEAAV